MYMAETLVGVEIGEPISLGPKSCALKERSTYESGLGIDLSEVEVLCSRGTS